MTECSHPAQHDWVVESMHGNHDLTCHYVVECSRCGMRQSGEADEIPTARFK